MNEIAVRDDRAVIALLVELEQTGAADEVSLTLTDPDMPYETWESLGRFLGTLDKRVRWYIGDWLNFGESVYGEEAAQGVESTVTERYSIAERVTGLDHGTLMNIRSVCARVAKPRRRAELGFWLHAEVAALDPDEQTAWLDRCIEEGWSKADLRDAIRAAKGMPALPPGDDPEPGEPGLTPSERIEQAARLVFHTWQATSDGSFLVPPEPAAQLAAALGEGE